MKNITYDIEKLCKFGDFSMAYAGKKFNIRQEYFNLLTDFTISSKQYLRSYNPIVVIYESKIREEFLEELEKIENKFTAIGIKCTVPELITLREAVNNGDVKTLSDGIKQFSARMQIISKQIISAQIESDGNEISAPGVHFRPQIGVAKPLILAVDDKAELLTSINGMLSDSYRVIAVTSGVSAMKAIEVHTPAIFLLDIEMPMMNGYELAKKIREDVRFNGAPILFLTAKSTRAHVITAMAYGGSDYILKPVEKDILLKKIRYHLEKC